MMAQQNEFSTSITELENTVSQFSQFQDINQHEEVAGMVSQIYDKIKEFIQKAKVFNNREYLTGNPTTDYTQLDTLKKDFEPYYELWSTTNTWFNNHEKWLNGKWEELDAVKMEDIVTNSIKTLNKIIRIFKEKDQPGILKIGNQVKNELTEYQPFVPLALALRKDGMKERHWEAISKKVGFKVEPYDGFTF